MASSAIVEIQMPQMGESVTEGTVLEWHKQEGDQVEEGETVVEVSTDKVDAEVPAPASGTIIKILKGEDETIEVGGVLAELDPSAAPSGDGASAEAPEAEVAETAEPQPEEPEQAVATEAPDGEAVQIVMPEMGESVAEGTILEWHKQEGDQVEEGETVVEVSTDKVDAEVPAPASGTITRILKGEDETIEVGGVLGELDPVAAPSGIGSGAEAADEDREPGPVMSMEGGGEGDS